MDTPFFVSETPGACGGYPCIRNMRVPVRCIVEHYRLTNDVDATAAMYDMVSRDDILRALAWYERNPARVDEDIARNARAWAEITAPPVASSAGTAAPTIVRADRP